MKYININKLKTFKFSRDNTYIVIDFDNTITGHNSADSWSVAGSLLGKEFIKNSETLCKKYKPIELNYTMPFEEKNKAMETWYNECMMLYYKYKLTKNQLIESVKTGNLVFRKGAKDFLKRAYDENIPVVILSAGIGNVIKEFLILQDCYYSNIYIISNFIEFDELGFAKKFDTSTIIHSLNKSMKDKALTEKLKNKTYKILIGDLIEDINMVEIKESDTTLKIGILDKPTNKLIEIYNNAFDILLTEEDACFEEIKKILE